MKHNSIHRPQPASTTILGSCLALIFTIGTSLAIDTTGTGGEWTSTSTWAGGVVPVIGDGQTAQIVGDDTVTVTSGIAGVGSRIIAGSVSGTTGALLIQGGTLIVGHSVTNQQDIFGNTGTRTGTLTITSGIGSFQTGGFTNTHAYFGNTATNVGILNQTGGTLFFGNNLRLGQSGTGIGSIGGGSLVVGTTLVLAQNASGIGSLTITGGNVTATNVDIGNLGVGVFAQTGGSFTVSGSFDAGNGNAAVPGALGIANITGGNLTVGNLRAGVGSNSEGEITVGAGATLTTSVVQAGIAEGAKGIIDITGQDLTLTGALNAASAVNSGGAIDFSASTVNLSGTPSGFQAGSGAGSAGTINFTNGSVASGTVSVINAGTGAGADGVIDVTIDGSLVNNGALSAGTAADASGQITVRGGTLAMLGNNNTDDINAGTGANSSGTIIFEGTARAVGTVNDDLLVATGGTSIGAITLRVAEGASLDVVDDLLIGNAAGSTGSLAVLNGLLNVGVGNNGLGTGHDSILRLGNGAGASGVLTVDGGTVRTVDSDANTANAGDILVGGGANTTGIVNILSGQLQAQNQLIVANNASAMGSVTISGGVLNTNAGSSEVVNDLIGSTGTGFLNLSSGIVNFNSNSIGTNDAGNETDVVVGNSANSYGQVDQSGGTVNVGRELFVGSSGMGVYNMSGGAIVADGEISVGNNGSGMGVFNFSGGAPFVLGADGFNSGTGNTGNSFNVGVSGLGVLNVTGGVFDLAGTSGSLRIATGAAGTGVVNQTGGEVRTNGGSDIVIGQTGLGTYNISGGTAFSNSDVFIGGADTTLNNASNGTGVLNVTGGVFEAATTLYVGADADQIDNGPVVPQGMGIANISGGIATANAITVGQLGVGSLNVTGGLVASDTNLIFGGGAGVGTINNNTVPAALAFAGAGYANITGGTVIVENNLFIGNANGAMGSVYIGGNALVQEGAGNDGIGGGGNFMISLGNAANSTGILEIAGGTLQTLDTVATTDGGNLMVGDAANSTGVLIQSGGLIDLEESLTIGNVAGSTGTALFSGGQVITDGAVNVGNNGNGVAGISGNALVTPGGNINIGLGAGGIGMLSQSGGLASLSGGSDIIVGNTGSGTYTITGGTAFSDDDIFIGGDSTTTNNNSAGTGVLNVMGGVFEADDVLYVGADVDLVNEGPTAAVSLGIMNVSGGIATAQNLYVGNVGTGHLNVTGGLVDVAGALNFAQASAVSTINNSTVPATLTVYGSGFGNLTGGTVNVDGSINVGNVGNGMGSVNIAGTAVVDATQIVLANGNNRTGVVTQSGGTVTVQSRLFIGGGDATSMATYSLAGGVLQLGSSVGGAGTLQIDTDSNDNFADVTGGILRPTTNGGDIVLNTNATSDVNLAGGTLDMRGGDLIDSSATSTVAGNADVNLSSGAILNAAVFDADVTQTGGLIDISADGAQRVMELSNSASGGTAVRDLTASGGTIVIDLFSEGVIGSGAGGAAGDSSTTSGVNSAIIAGNVNLVGVTIKVVNSGVSSFDLNEEWDIFDWFDTLGGNETGGTMASLNVGVDFFFDFSMAGGAAIWDTSRFESQGIIFSVIPEPGRALLAAVGFGAFLLQRRRRWIL